MTKTVLKRADSGNGLVVAIHETSEERSERILKALFSSPGVHLTKGQEATLDRARSLDQDATSSWPAEGTSGSSGDSYGPRAPTGTTATPSSRR